MTIGTVCYRFLLAMVRLRVRTNGLLLNVGRCGCCTGVRCGNTSLFKCRLRRVKLILRLVVLGGLCWRRNRRWRSLTIGRLSGRVLVCRSVGSRRIPALATRLLLVLWGRLPFGLMKRHRVVSNVLKLMCCRWSIPTIRVVGS